eukprot:UN24444
MRLLGVITREYISQQCTGQYPQPPGNAGTLFHPVFDIENSGFVYLPGSPHRVDNSTSSNTLRLMLTIPREYFDFTINFVNGTGVAGHNTINSAGYWGATNVLDLTSELCGDEVWQGNIPWPVFNEEGAGGVEVITQFQTNFTETITDQNGFWYMFKSILEVTGKEAVYTTAQDELTGQVREWRTTRDLVWKVPFVIRMQRFVFVKSDAVDVAPGSLGITHVVAALTEYIQAGQIYDLDR